MEAWLDESERKTQLGSFEPRVATRKDKHVSSSTKRGQKKQRTSSIIGDVAGREDKTGRFAV